MAKDTTYYLKSNRIALVRCTTCSGCHFEKLPTSSRDYWCTLLQYNDQNAFSSTFRKILSLFFFVFFFVVAQWTLPNVILIRDIDMFSTYVPI